MSTMEQEIENVLRAAPRPMPPAGLKERLIAQVRLPAVQPASQPSASPLAPTGWLRRWWPVLAPAAVSLACAVGLTLQETADAMGVATSTVKYRLRQALIELQRKLSSERTSPVPTATSRMI